MSDRIEACFAAARQAGRKVLIPFVTAGDPDPELTVALMHGLVQAGADLIELGVPFSDPMADGPVIQASSERAIARGVDLAQVQRWVGEFRASDDATPVVLMGYMNPFERFGLTRLAARTAEAGVDGLLIVDCPPEELGALAASLDTAGVANIRLVALTTTGPRLQQITRGARGFIYYVSFKGTTGAGHLDAPALEEPIARLRQHSPLPIAVGFGINSAEAACAVARHADGVVIGSALVERLAACSGRDAVLAAAHDFMGGIRRALDAPA